MYRKNPQDIRQLAAVLTTSNERVSYPLGWGKKIQFSPVSYADLAYPLYMKSLLDLMRNKCTAFIR